MKAALDTNVVVSGLLTPQGVCGRILRLVFAGETAICVDQRICHEYETVLPRPLFRIREQDVVDVLRVIRMRAEVVVPPPISVALPDETDLPFLEVASAAGAILVTGNARHFPKRACGAVTVLRPAEFLDRLSQSS